MYSGEALPCGVWSQASRWNQSQALGMYFRFVYLFFPVHFMAGWVLVRWLVATCCATTSQPKENLQCGPFCAFTVFTSINSTFLKWVWLGVAQKRTNINTRTRRSETKNTSFFSSGRDVNAMFGRRIIACGRELQQHPISSKPAVPCNRAMGMKYINRGGICGTQFSE